MLLSLRPIVAQRGRAFVAKLLATCSTNKPPPPPLASDLYPPIDQRGTRLSRGPFSRIDSKDLSIFADIVGPNHVITDEIAVQTANTDWPRDIRGQGSLVLRPSSTDEVSKILQHCNNRRIAVVPQGGNTSLAGASVPVFDEVVLSLSRMNRVLKIDPVSGTAIAESGCILAQLDAQLSGVGLTVPLDLGSKASCQLGGNFSTNAGGVRVLRYGSLRASVRGLEAVLASGEVLDCLDGCESSHGSLVQLMIGSEGTLGVLTKIALACPLSPANVQLTLIGCHSFQSVLDIFSAARAYLAETLSAFEFMDADTMSAVSDNLQLKCPLSSGARFYALVETASCDADGAHDVTKMDRFFDHLTTSISDGSSASIDAVVASDSRQFEAIWSLRERAFEALLCDGGPAGGYMQFDVCVSNRLDMIGLVQATKARFSPDVENIGGVIRIAGFGHLGDGNLHLVVTADSLKAVEHNLWPKVESFVYNWLSRRRGSISAEHGLGWKRSAYLGHCKTPAAVNVMVGIKQLLDPRGILNPYKVLPQVAYQQSNP